MLNVKVALETRNLDRLRARLNGGAMRAVFQAASEDLAAQVRKNILVDGGPGGRWPALSEAYARRKDAGKTPGKGAHSGSIRLRDTGAMFEGIKGMVRQNGKSVVVSVVSEGSLPGRPTNTELLVIHAKGKGTNPRRDPTRDMTVFLKRFRDRVRRLLSK